MYILTLIAFCINVKFILIIQGDIFLNKNLDIRSYESIIYMCV